ncbi:hypothetical protein ACI782_25140 [Geodermatophilus sp. SYSU D00703]
MTRALLRVALALVVVAAGLLVPVSGSTPSGSAQAADLRYFDAGNIISDAIFFDSRSMDAAAVQRFLDTKGANCVAGEMPCIKNYRQDTATQAGDDWCSTYQGARQETAASIITKVGIACDINPRVLLVLLQKEQGLITGTQPTTRRYTAATGFGCPDTAACNPSFSGFVSQVYFAARQFQRYADGVAGSYRAGRDNTILYHPNRDCGSSQVHIANKATAGLYSYTPYQPNRAALAAGYGTGDSCSSYGNRNFWNYFTDWFGSTQSTGGAAIYEKYVAYGGSGGSLGAATTGINCGLTAGGCFQAFANGSIYWTKSTGANVVSDSVRTRWSQLGWELGALGYPTMDTWCGLTGGGCFQTFQGGSLYATSRTAKAWFVRGAIRDAWEATGWETGSLGFPTSDENCGLRDGGCFQTFQHGAVYWTETTGARPVLEQVLGPWGALEWETGVLGYPTSGTSCGRADGGCAQRFQGGVMYWSPATGGHWVRGPIADAYDARGNESGVLGYPIQDLSCGLTGGGCYTRFQNGSIHWSPATTARATMGAIRTKWAATGAQRGPLGYPVDAQQCGLAGGGCAQRFQGGWIYSSPDTPASLIRGGLREAWRANGAQNGVLGYPIGDENCGLRGGWCFQQFEHGAIYWSSSTGGRVVLSQIAEGWGALGWENGPLGYPTMSTRCGLADAGCAQRFSGGTIYWSEATGAHSVSGPIRDAYAALGYQNGRLGYPLEEAQAVTGGMTQRFQGGTLRLDTRTGKVTRS